METTKKGIPRRSVGKNDSEPLKFLRNAGEWPRGCWVIAGEGGGWYLVTSFKGFGDEGRRETVLEYYKHKKHVESCPRPLAQGALGARQLQLERAAAVSRRTAR